MNEPTPSSQIADAQFTAGDVKEAAGLSYRQLDDWDSKGAVSSRREGETGWRKFSPREVFALMVCGEIRRRFGVPVESLRWVKDFMLQEGADHFSYAVETIAKDGLTIWLLTDLKETFIMDNDLEFEDMLHYGYFRGDDPSAYIFLKINPLVNRLLTAHKPPIELKVHDAVYAVKRNVESQLRVQTNAEREVLRLIRQKDFQRVTVHLSNGGILRADVEEDLPKADAAKLNKQILDAIKGREFATVTVRKADGQVVGLNRKSTIKFDKVTGKP